jgi:hypothetical protein
MSDPSRQATDQLRRLSADLALELDLGAATVTGPEPVLAARYPLASSAAAVLAAVGLMSDRIFQLRGGPSQHHGRHPPRRCADARFL